MKTLNQINRIHLNDEKFYALDTFELAGIVGVLQGAKAGACEDVESALADSERAISKAAYYDLTIASSSLARASEELAKINGLLVTFEERYRTLYLEAYGRVPA